MIEQQPTLDDARAERDAALAKLEADADNVDRQVIDQAIRVYAETGMEFSANDLRYLLPDVRRPLIGARFLAARKRGVIAPVSYTGGRGEVTPGSPTGAHHDPAPCHAPASTGHGAL